MVQILTKSETFYDRSIEMWSDSRNQRMMWGTLKVRFAGRKGYKTMLTHYENTPMQYTAIFHGLKNDNFQMKNCDIFLIFAQNIDCGYTLEPPQRGGSNEYPQSMFWSKNKKNMYTRVNPTFSI